METLELPIPQLTDEEFALKEFLYEYIAKEREFYVRLPRPPRKGIWEKFEHLRPTFQRVAEQVFSNKVIRKILSDYIVSISEFRTFVDELTKELRALGYTNGKNIALHLAMDLMGFGPLGFALLRDDVEEIVVNGPDEVFAYVKGKGYARLNITFESRADILELIEQIAYIHGKKLDERRPFLDAVLPDGSRVNATLPVVTPHSPTITVRKFSKHKLGIPDLIRFGTLTPEAAAFLWMAVEGYGIRPANILVIGGTASGKTTLLNALLAFIPPDKRIITVEDTRELYVPHANRVHMVTREGISMNDLLKNALRMRPDRIIVGEVRGEESITLFQAMDVGHRGTMGTLHANSPREAEVRLTNPPMNVPENMLPLIDYFVLIKKFPDGSRKVVEITECLRGETTIALSPIFKLQGGTLERVGSLGRKMEVLAEDVGRDLHEILDDLQHRVPLLTRAAEEGMDYNTFFCFVHEEF